MENNMSKLLAKLLELSSKGYAIEIRSSHNPNGFGVTNVKVSFTSKMRGPLVCRKEFNTLEFSLSRLSPDDMIIAEIDKMVQSIEKTMENDLVKKVKQLSADGYEIAFTNDTESRIKVSMWLRFNIGEKEYMFYAEDAVLDTSHSDYYFNAKLCARLDAMVSEIQDKKQQMLGGSNKHE